MGERAGSGRNDSRHCEKCPLALRAVCTFHGCHEAKRAAEQTWDYSFSVWPHERGFERVVYDLFRLGLNRRILVEGWTHARFVDFKESLARNGFTLREVERVPYVSPEAVL